MLAAKTDFDRRVKEIEEYILYLESLELQTGISVTLMATMKSSAILMLYNLVESTMTNIVQAIFDHLHNSSIGLSSLNDVMKALVLKNVKKRNPNKLVEKMRASSLDVAIASFDRTDVYSGNVDSQKIRETLTEFGVVRPGKLTEAVLLEIKNVRNDLAHGAQSFADVGKIYTAQDLKEKLVKVCKILERTLTIFKNYVQTGAYA
jgi:MAE_28990/MAE_18760-like HEPN